MKRYFISKDKYNGEVVYINCNQVNGYKITPKNNVSYDGIIVNTMMIIKPTFVEKVIKRKIKAKIDYYLKLIIDNLDGNNDEEDTRRALSDIERYKITVNDKYAFYLEEKYLTLLNKKIDVIKRELKNTLNYFDLVKEELEINRTR